MKPDQAIKILKSKKDTCKIVVNEHLDSYPQKMSNLKPEYYLVRNDGWVVACTYKHLKITANLWKDTYSYLFKSDNLNNPIPFKELIY